MTRPDPPRRAIGRTPAPEAIRVQPWRESQPPSRILAIRLQAMGDTVLTLPYLQALRRMLPHGASLDFLTREEVVGVPKCVTLFDEVFEIGGGRRRHRQLLSAVTLLPRLLRRRYDVVLDLQRNHVSRLVRMALRPRAWSEFDRFSPELAGERTRKTIEAAGLGPLDVYPDVRLSDAEAGESALRNAGWDGAAELLILNPAGAFADRGWPLDSYAEFAGLWQRESRPAVQFVVLGLPSLAAKGQALKTHLRDNVLNLVGQTTAAEAFAIVSRAQLVISEDSGLMHMAWVAGVPTLGLFGASRAVWASPHGNYSDCLDVCEQADGACMDGYCRDAPTACLERLTAESVVDRANALLNRIDGQPKLIHVAVR